MSRHPDPVPGRRVPKGAGDCDIDILLVNPMVSYRTDVNVGTMGVPEDYLVRCINPGLLSIATWLEHRGRSVAILDFQDDSSARPLQEFLARHRPRVVGVSCMTGFAYLHALELADRVRGLAPQTMIVFGGQHVGPQALDVLRDGAQIDVVALYEGEEVTDALIDVAADRRDLADIPGIAWRADGNLVINQSYPQLLPLEEIPPLRYDLYPRFQTFMPYVEESRGCYARCEYCITPFTNNYRIRRKSAARILQEVDHVQDLWGTSRSGETIAMLAATFGVQLGETLELMSGLAARPVRWSTEIRADSKLLDHLGTMNDSGISNLFVGMESASSTQLARMDKTRKAEDYLDRMRAMLANAAQYDNLLLKVGLLLYVGESAQTMRETLGFLLSVQEHVRWVSVSPLFVFGGTPLHKRFDEYAARYGSSLHSDGFWKASRTFPCNVSPEFDFNASVEAARFIERIFRDHTVFERVFTRADDVPQGIW
jgi:radical SAM superfamily enzyme YgiQ (UPF0313 family)